MCQSVMWLRCAKMAKWIEVLFLVYAVVDRWHSVLDGGSVPAMMRAPVNGEFLACSCIV